MENNTDGKANMRFPAYIFTKMDPEEEDKNCNETNVVTSGKFAHIRKWMVVNLLLITTVSGVLFGLFLGEFVPNCFTWSVSSYSHRTKQNQ
jgi:hypothetical protein